VPAASSCCRSAATRRATSCTHAAAAQVHFLFSFLSGSPYFSFKSLIPGAFNVGLMGATCTALPRVAAAARRRQPLLRAAHVAGAGVGVGAQL